MCSKVFAVSLARDARRDVKASWRTIWAGRHDRNHARGSLSQFCSTPWPSANMRPRPCATLCIPACRRFLVVVRVYPMQRGW